MYSYDRRAAENLKWRDWSKTSPWSGSDAKTVTHFYSEAPIPGSDEKYVIQSFGLDSNDPSETEQHWTVQKVKSSESSERHFFRSSQYITSTGGEQSRQGRRAWHPSQDAARKAAEANFKKSQVATPIDPETLAKRLSGPQKDFFKKFYQAKGMPDEFQDYGTKSEMSLRAWRTRMMNSLEKLGLVRGWGLTELGKEVGQFL